VDASNSLFSYKGKLPEYLPEKIRLSNGLTRYSSSVTQEELESCGYRGPVVLPDCSQDEYLVWESESNTFCVHTKTPSMLCCKEDFEVRRELESLLSVKDFEHRNSLTTEGKNKYDIFYGTVQSLLASDTLLTFDDIPSLEISCFEVEKTRQEYINSSGYLNPDGWQMQYEVNGVLVPRMMAAIDGYENDVMYSYLSSFVPPSDWVPSGYVLSGTMQ
jgi:hypothetical protein